MKHFHRSIIITIGLLCIPPISGQSTCPTGKPNTKAVCNKRQLCPQGSKCYRKDNKHFCCGDLDLFCPTKIHALNSYNSDTESYSWERDKSTDKKKWYDVKLGNETIGCPIPLSFTYKEYKQLTVLPVDFDEINKGTSKPKTCEANSDCNKENDEFCGATTHPTDGQELDRSGKNGAPLRFCYKFQNFGFDNIKPVIKADKTELEGCDSNSDCLASQGSDTFCFIKNTTMFVRIVNNEGTDNSLNGFCAVANVCKLKKHGSIIASLTKNNTFCKTNDDCQGSANAKKHPGMTPECVSFSSETSMCCSKHNKDCEHGNIQYPFKNCDNFDNCNSGGLVANKWCDEKTKQCCEDPEDKLWACPDGATPLFNEPKCNNISALVVDSGTCPNPVGICRRGHCCPPLKRISPTSNAFDFGEKAYVTNVACKPYEAVPNQFNYAFCDPEKKKIVIWGSTDADGNKIGNSETKCNSKQKCETGKVCVKQVEFFFYCHRNPLKKMPVKKIVPPIKLWRNMLIGSVLGAIVSFAATVICFIFHYKPSVFKKKKRPAPVVVWVMSPEMERKAGIDEIGYVQTFHNEEEEMQMRNTFYPYPPETGSDAWTIYKMSVKEKNGLAKNRYEFGKLSDESKQIILRSLEEAWTQTKIVKINIRFGVPDWLDKCWVIQEKKAEEFLCHDSRKKDKENEVLFLEERLLQKEGVQDDEKLFGDIVRRKEKEEEEAAKMLIQQKLNK